MAILFFVSGRLDWAWAWLFVAINLTSILVIGVFKMRSNPEIIAERGRLRGMKRWDKIVGDLWGSTQFISFRSQLLWICVSV
jgi:O-antigen/teichoic acid export membrane protein